MFSFDARLRLFRGLRVYGFAASAFGQLLVGFFLNLFWMDNNDLT